jgi:glycosyltransferase involved in cell wall biosynthesis
MRIAVYCPHYEDAGGVQEVVRRLSAGMVALGHPVHLVARLPGGGCARPARPRPVDRRGRVARPLRARAPSRRRRVATYRHFTHRFPSSAIRLVRAVRAERPELIATHCSKFHAPYVAALRATLRVPFVVHLHNGPQTADGPESLVLSRLLLRCASRVIAVSSAVGDYARGVLPARAARVVTIPNGADQDEFAEVPPAVRARPYVLGAGALAERKGFDVLIDAFADARIDLDLVFAGDGPERARLEAHATARGIAGRVAFLGHVDPRDGREPPSGRPRRRDAVPVRGTSARRSRGDARGRAARSRARSRDSRSSCATARPGCSFRATTLPRSHTPSRGSRRPRTRRGALGRAAREAARRFPSWDAVTERVLQEYGRALT